MTKQQGKGLRWLPIPIILTVAGLLLVALWAGLARLGVPGVQSNQMMMHGPLMVSAVMGTLICLERAVALNGVLQSRWKSLAFLAPTLNALGGILLVVGWQNTIAQSLVLLGSAGLVVIFVVIMRHHTSSDVAIMTLGAVALFVGNGLWLIGRPVFEVVHWWLAFLVLTIVGERLELSRIRQITSHQRQFLMLIILLYFAGIILTDINLALGSRLEGLGSILMAIWLFRYDAARVTIRHGKLAQFAAICLLSGYIWLGAGGAIVLWQGALYAGLFYEAFLHAVLVGYVMSMIFGHAPIIVPALTGYSMQFNSILYVPLILLHSSLILRIVSNLIVWIPGRQWGGTFNVVAILLYFMLIPYLVLSSKFRQIPN